MHLMILKDKSERNKGLVPDPYFFVGLDTISFSSFWLDPDPHLYLSFVPIEMHLMLFHDKERNRE